MKAVEVNHLTFGFHQPLFRDFHFTVDQGECVAITGPSGSGKSTLAWILAGIIPRAMDFHYEGEVKILGRDIRAYSLAEAARTIGLVFQNPDAQLFSPSVFDEIAFGPENLCLPRKEILAVIDRSLEQVGLAEYKNAEIETLSGGQKQLVALASVLACDPKILLFDEVFSFLDEDATRQVQQVIRDLADRERTVLFIDHNREHLALADRLIEIGGAL